MLSPEPATPPGRRWNPWEIAPIHGVDTAGIGLLRVRVWRFRRPRIPGAGNCLTPLRCVSQPTQCFNTAVWQGAAPPPLDPMAFRATGGTAGGGGPHPEPRPRFVPTVVPRRSAKRRSAIAANPSPAILRASARDLSGVEGEEPLGGRDLPVRQGLMMPDDIVLRTSRCRSRSQGLSVRHSMAMAHSSTARTRM